MLPPATILDERLLCHQLRQIEPSLGLFLTVTPKAMLGQVLLEAADFRESGQDNEQYAGQDRGG